MSETSKKIEDDLQNQHEQEMYILEEEIEAAGEPPIKFSADLLNKKFRLTQLIKIKKYTEAKLFKEELNQQEERELITMEENHIKSMNKLRETKRKKQISEYESVKARLEKNINSKLKQRMNEYEKLLLRIQNVHNDMSSKQAREFKSIQQLHSKLLAKYSLNIENATTRHAIIAEINSEYEDNSEIEEIPLNNGANEDSDTVQNDYEPLVETHKSESKASEYENDSYTHQEIVELVSVEGGEVIKHERIELVKNTAPQQRSSDELIETEHIEEGVSSDHFENVHNFPKKHSDSLGPNSQSESGRGFTEKQSESGKIFILIIISTQK